MRHTLTGRRAAIAVTAVALAATATLAGPASAAPVTATTQTGQASASQTGLATAATLTTAAAQLRAAQRAAEPVSTPVPISTPDGLLMSYVVNARYATSAQTKLVQQAVRRADNRVFGGLAVDPREFRGGGGARQRQQR